MTEENKEEKIEIPEKFKKLVEEIEKMSVIDLAELVKILEKKFGISATPQIVSAPSSVPATTTPPTSSQEEKSTFNVVLASPGEKKIEVIKIVREITGKGLKESKDIVDASTNEPQVLKENVAKAEAEEIKKKLEAAGAKVELK